MKESIKLQDITAILIAFKNWATLNTRGATLPAIVIFLIFAFKAFCTYSHCFCTFSAVKYIFYCIGLDGSLVSKEEFKLINDFSTEIWWKMKYFAIDLESPLNLLNRLFLILLFRWNEMNNRGLFVLLSPSVIETKRIWWRITIIKIIILSCWLIPEWLWLFLLVSLWWKKYHRRRKHHRRRNSPNHFLLLLLLRLWNSTADEI